MAPRRLKMAKKHHALNASKTSEDYADHTAITTGFKVSRDYSLRLPSSEVRSDGQKGVLRDRVNRGSGTRRSKII
jgi:hypothetical protein